jgi:hypothetical protein
VEQAEHGGQIIQFLARSTSALQQLQFTTATWASSILAHPSLPFTPDDPTIIQRCWFSSAIQLLDPTRHPPAINMAPSCTISKQIIHHQSRSAS